MSDFILDKLDPLEVGELIEERQDKERSAHHLHGEQYVWDDAVEITSGTEKDGRNEHDPAWVDIDDKDDGTWEADVIDEVNRYAKSYPESEVVWLSGMMREVVKLGEDWEEEEPTGIYWCIEIKV